MQGGAENKAAGEGLSEAGAGAGSRPVRLRQSVHAEETWLGYFPQAGKSIPWSMDRRKAYLSTACWIRLIQLLRSSLELV